MSVCGTILGLFLSWPVFTTALSLEAYFMVQNNRPSSASESLMSCCLKCMSVKCAGFCLHVTGRSCDMSRTEAGGSPTRNMTCCTRERDVEDLEEPDETSRDIRGRLLLVPRSSSYQESVYQLCLSNMSVQRYSSLTLSHVAAVGYVEKTRKVVMAITQYPYKILAYTLDGQHSILYQQGTYCSGIAVDNGRDLLFLTCSKGVYNMAADGQRFHLLIRNPHVVTSALDTQSRKIYSCTESIIYVWSYEGRSRKTLVMWKDGNTLVFSPLRRELYYADKNDIYKIHVNKPRVPLKAASLRRSAKSLVYRDNKISVSLANGDVGVLLDSTYRQISAGLERRNTPAIMCVVP